MSEYADKHSKAHRKERVEHLLGSTKGKVDASGYEVPGELKTEEKTGARPKPRAFAKGGKVEGHKAHHHAGRKSRDAGGQAAVNQLRPQVPTSGLYGSGFQPTHAGMLSSAAGLKKGGEAKRKAKGGSIANEMTGVRITGGRKARADGGAAQRHNGESKAEYRLDEQDRTARKDGGRAKGKTNINIIIGAPKDDKAGMVPPPPSAIPPGSPLPKPGLPPAAMGAMQPPGMGGGPAGGAGPMPPQMPAGMMPR